MRTLLAKTLLLVGYSLVAIGCGTTAPEHGPAPTAATFRVTNSKTSAAYVQNGSFLSVQDGSTALRLATGFCPVLCGGSCEGVPCPAIAILPTVRRLDPGDFLDYAWDGKAWTTEPAGCGPQRACDTWTGLSPRQLTAKSTYSVTFQEDPAKSVGTDGNTFAAQLDANTLTAETSFAYPAAGTVTIEIK